MPHLSDGVLRRMLDEPLAIAARQKHHYDDCQGCQARSHAIADEASAVAQLMAVPELNLSPEPALSKIRRGIEAGEAARPVTPVERLTTGVRLSWPRAYRPVALLAFAALLLGVLGASGLAQSLVKIFEPQRFQAVQVQPTDLNRLGVVLDYGKLHWTSGPPDLKPVTSRSQAAQQSGLAVLAPGALPSGIPSSVSYLVAPRTTGSLVLSAATLASSAKKAGVTVSPMPASIDGSTLYLDAGPAVMEVYGGGAPNAAGIFEGFPALVILETRTPTVSSTGATQQQLEDYLLSQPGVPPEVAAQIRAIKNPNTTLPVPIPSGLASSRQVQVQGAQGLLVDAGIASGVVWQKDGVIYAVVGQVTPDQVVAIADSLH